MISFGEKLLYPQGSRLFPFLWGQQVAWAMQFAAIESRLKAPEAVGAAYHGLPSRTREIMVIQPIVGILDLVVKSEKPDEVVLWLKESRVGLARPESAIVIGTGAVMHSVVEALFSVYASQCNDWLRSSVGNTGYEKWPPVSNFARVVRNAIVHGGTINIDSKTAPSVEWKGIVYDSTKKGRSIFDDMIPGDYIELAVDLDKELDGLGAPQSLP